MPARAAAAATARTVLAETWKSCSSRPRRKLIYSQSIYNRHPRITTIIIGRCSRATRACLQIMQTTRAAAAAAIKAQAVKIAADTWAKKRNFAHLEWPASQFGQSGNSKLESPEGRGLNRQIDWYVSRNERRCCCSGLTNSRVASNQWPRRNDSFREACSGPPFNCRR